jgi:hypothetical protein
LEARCVLSTLVALGGDNHLLTFDSSAPGMVTDVAVSGLQPNEQLAAIAFRPSDGQLFGVTFGALYQLDAATGSAALVGAFPTNASLTERGASFDPTSGKLRVAGVQHQNLLIDPTSGSFTTDTAFHYRLGDRLQGNAEDIQALAYTNEVANATTTTLYAFDGLNARDLSIVGGPNGNPGAETGGLSTVANLTPAWSVFTIGGADNTAYGVLGGPSGNNLYKVDLGTGGTGTLVGTIGGARGPIGLAVKPDGAATAPTTLSVRDAAVSESAAGPVTADFTVKLSAASAQAVTVSYRTANDTAFAGRDYQAVRGTLTFAPGQTLQTIHVPIAADAPSALPETFFVQLSSPLGASLARAVAVGTIRADSPPQPLVPSGIYVEDFSDDKDLSKPAFDSTGVFQHFFTIADQAHTVNDPTDTNEPTFGYRIDTGGPPPAVTFPSPTLIVSGATDRVTFPNLVPGTHVAFAAVDVTALAGTGTVRIVGENGVFEESVAVGQPTKTVSVGEEHVLPSGLELGPISEIDLFGTVVGFDNVKVLVVPDRPPNANDVFADTPPDTFVVIDVLAHDSSQDGGPLRLLSVGPTGVAGGPHQQDRRHRHLLSTGGIQRKGQFPLHDRGRARGNRDGYDPRPRPGPAAHRQRLVPTGPERPPVPRGGPRQGPRRVPANQNREGRRRERLALSQGRGCPGERATPRYPRLSRGRELHLHSHGACHRRGPVRDVRLRQFYVVGQRRPGQQRGDGDPSRSTGRR